MKKISIFMFSIVLIVSVFSACSKKAIEPINPEDTATGYDVLGGLWKVGAFYYNGRIVDVHDNSAIEDMYKTDYLFFKRDGSYAKVKPLIYGGEYIPNPADESNQSYVLSTTSVKKYKDGELVEEEYKSDVKYVVTIVDENTIRYAEYNPVTGKEQPNSSPLLYVKDTSASKFIDENKANISFGYNTTENINNDQTTSSVKSRYNSYNDILIEYTNKMKNSVADLVNEYYSESAGISDITELADICNEKVGVLADICNEGIGKMADLMMVKNDSYDVYESWSKKLMDNYTDIASQIQDAYINSVI